MDTYQAQVRVPYHSGQLMTFVQIQAAGYFQARSVLEHLYGQGNVFAVIKQI